LKVTALWLQALIITLDEGIFEKIFARAVEPTN